MVKLSNIVQEMGEMEGVEIYLHLPTGNIFQFFEGESSYSYLSEKDISELSAEEQKNAQIAFSFEEHEADFQSFPSKYDIHEYQIMEKFCYSVTNERVQESLAQSIKGRGAFRRFRDTLDRFNLTPKWYTFRERAFYEVAIEWCIDHKIEYLGDRPLPTKSKKALSMEQIVKDWERNTKKKSDANFQFLTSLKFKPPNRVDKVAKEMHEEAFEKIDCKNCANCCKTARLTLEADDIERIATHLSLPIEAVERDYLQQDEDGSWGFNALPCPFLSTQNLCAIYEARPIACQDYPNTGKDGFTSRRYQHSSNSEICPASYYIVERMKEYFGG